MPGVVGISSASALIGAGMASRGKTMPHMKTKGTEVASGTGPSGDKIHFENFVAAIRDGAKLNSEIGDAQKSTLLCHLGNIARWTGRKLQWDPVTEQFVGDPEANQFLDRERRKPWVAPEKI